MSKPVKNLITESYKRKFADCDGVVVVSMRGVPANDNVAMRDALAEKGIKVTIVKNTLAKKATTGTPLEAVHPLLDGPCAFAYTLDPEASVVNVAREIMDNKKQTFAGMEICGAVMENAIFPDEKAVEALSKYPTREEAIGKVVAAMLGPAAMLSKTMTDQGGKLAGAISAPGVNIASLLKVVEEKGGELKKTA